MVGKSKENKSNENKFREVSVVKIDSSLLKEAEEFIEKEENRLRFTNKKQFIDIAVFEFLKKLKKKEAR